MIPFINIHTHHDVINVNEISLFNILELSLDKKTQFEFYSVGIHPWYINETLIDEQFVSLQSLSNSVSCLAIGECGLDKLKGPDLNVQESIFERQINLAIKLNKPVLVHCVQAFDRLLAIIKKNKNKVVFIVHGFNQKMQIAQQLLQLGAYLSFGAALLNDKNEKLKIIFEQIPLDRIFLENDDAAIPIKQIYDAAAVIKKCDTHVVKEIIFANYKQVFLHE